MRLGEKPESYILFYIFVFFFFFYPNNTKEVNTNDFLCSFWSFVWWRIPVVQRYLFASPGCHWSNNPYRTVRHCALFFICINDRVTFFHRREKESFLHSLQSLMWPFAVMLVVKCGKKTGLSLFSKVRTSKWYILNRGEFIWDIRQLETSTLLILYSAAGSFVSCVGWIWIYVTRVAAWALTQGDHLLQSDEPLTFLLCFPCQNVASVYVELIVSPIKWLKRQWDHPQGAELSVSGPSSSVLTTPWRISGSLAPSPPTPPSHQRFWKQWGPSPSVSSRWRAAFWE